MADYKSQFVSEVSEALVGQISQNDIGIVSGEMTLALRDYELTKRVTDLVKYDGVNELILKRYKACLVIAGRSPKTIAQYERTIKKLFITLQKNYTDMTVSDLRYFLAYEKSRGVSNRTLENTRVHISAFFTWLLDEELIYKNPCRAILPIKYTKEVKLPFSAIEIDAIRSSCKTKKERAIIEFLLASGVRVSELCAVRISDINFDTLSVVVREGKGAKQRTVYINDLASKHLVEYLTSRNISGDYLFYNKQKEQLNPGGVRHILKTIEKRAGVSDVHPHRFRRTFATGLANRGMEIQEIGKLLGHASLNTTLTYVYTSEEKIRTSYLKFTA
jgi:site-specific recombinase XerD